MKQNYVYMVECSDGTYYTGWTNDIEKRLRMHNSKKGAKYTRSRTPVKLVYLEEADTRRQAMRREASVKSLDRREKEELVKRCRTELAAFCASAASGCEGGAEQ